MPGRVMMMRRHDDHNIKPQPESRDIKSAREGQGTLYSYWNSYWNSYSFSSRMACRGWTAVSSVLPLWASTVVWQTSTTVVLGHQQEQQEQQEWCELYLAPSTIPNAGLGVYSGVQKLVGDEVGNGDLAFPLLELDWHHNYAMDPGNPDFDFFDPFSNYVWDGATMGMGMETGEQGEMTALWPGMDCAINCMIPLENVKRAFPRHNSHQDTELNDYMPHRSKDPAAGAVTTYRSGNTIVTREIPAGGELFKHYGDQWFETRPEVFMGLPLRKSFPLAQRIVTTYTENFVSKFIPSSSSTDSKQAPTAEWTPLWDLLMEVQTIWSETGRSLNALPGTPEDLKLSYEKDLTYMYQPNATRSLDWLKEEGRCMDNITPKPSTIQGAGEGAFAKRFLPKGSIITGSPILVIPDEEYVNMYKFIKDPKTKQWRKQTESDATTELPPYAKQVVNNYCLGHSQDSTILLFPYGSGVHYLNHPSRGFEANVRIEWAPDGKVTHDSNWLNLPPEAFEDEFNVHLGIDYIALRDIREGEELFLDYGKAWESAWEEHVRTWTPNSLTTIAADWNTRREAEPIRTVDEELENPYPLNIEIRCHVDLIEPDWADHQKDSETPNWAQYVRGEEEYETVYGLPCDVLRRYETNATSSIETYDVALQVDHLSYRTPRGYVEQLGDHQRFLRVGVPREAIFFLDAPYQSDLYLEGAFRYPIQIPEHMFPDAWKNRNKPIEVESPPQTNLEPLEPLQSDDFDDVQQDGEYEYMYYPEGEDGLPHAEL